MSTKQLKHSIKVPRFYKVAAKTLQLVQEKGASLKGVIFDKSGTGKKHPRIKAIYALVVVSIHNADALDRLLRESQILIKERLNPWLGRVLIAELLWGKKKLPPSECKPVVSVLEYQPRFVGILREAVKSGTHENEPRQNKAALKPRYIRVNTLLMSVGDAITAFRHEGWRRATPSSDDYPGFLCKLATLEEDEFLQDFHVKHLFAFPPRTEFFEHELYLNGSLILQDKATCLAPHLLNPTPGSAVLDMCAAPGIKTTQLAAIMENKGTLYAVERHAARFKTLCDFVPRHGATCVTTIRADASTVTPQECQKVEYILVDPTCSGSGMDRPSSSKEGACDPARLKQLSGFQVILLERAMSNFPSARRVVYSTCSVHAEENEQVVARALELVSGWRVVDALGSWPNRGSEAYAVGPSCLRADPDKDLTTGFFVAVFERVAAENGGTKKKQRKKEEVGATRDGQEAKETEKKGAKDKKRKKEEVGATRDGQEVKENKGAKDKKRKKEKLAKAGDGEGEPNKETKHKRQKKKTGE